jgi:hypothetical protein
LAAATLGIACGVGMILAEVVAVQSAHDLRSRS